MHLDCIEMCAISIGRILAHNIFMENFTYPLGVLAVSRINKVLHLIIIKKLKSWESFFSHFFLVWNSVRSRLPYGRLRSAVLKIGKLN